MPASPPGLAPLDLQGLRYAYGRRAALDGVGFRVEPGRFTALLGPNGAGKSTLFALATGLLVPQAGRVLLHGHDLAAEPGKALAGLGVVFQQPTLDLDLTVAQNLRYFASLHGIGRTEAARRIEAELERVEMADRAGETVRRLNGGHRRRVEIARALLHRPSLLLLDEPTVGLDRKARLALIAHVRSLCRDRGLAVLWATHLIDEIDPAADRVVVLHRGRLLADCEAPELLAAAGASSVAEAFDSLTREEE
ncbi:ABC transporter ATP-binding protein [Azospirillum thermophilum]|uniref:ABC transporter ATP-binding protein n=1 Tax=Azospirillum thermophilum TaxID=2202148 RepID=A0A2S2CYV6_9PROT|nr:ABC transporter ATP-binding protein [Azospirillum thermophilum]AWK89702.1 ABC transporter ATP-binding protein [Azospirillum thermophilum]